MVDGIYSNEYAKKKLIFTNNKAFKNTEIYLKISEVRKRYEERELYEYTLEQTRSKFTALVLIYRKTDMLRKTLSGIKNFVQDKGYENSVPQHKALKPFEITAEETKFRRHYENNISVSSKSEEETKENEGKVRK